MDREAERVKRERERKRKLQKKITFRVKTKVSESKSSEMFNVSIILIDFKKELLPTSSQRERKGKLYYET